MMVKKLLFLILASGLSVWAQIGNKADFDIVDVPSNSLRLAKTLAVSETDRILIKGTALEIALMNDGAFTLGTGTGVVDGSIDDHVLLTYGHPFAKTSFFMIKSGGEWFGPLSTTALPTGTISGNADGNGASVMFTLPGGVDVELSVALDSTSSLTAAISVNVINTSEDAANVQVGFVVDPAVGNRNNDCAIWGPEGERVPDETNLGMLSRLDVTEKAKGHRGLRYSLSFPEGSSVITANWDRLYRNDFDLPAEPLLPLYDGAVVCVGEETGLAADGEVAYTLRTELQDADFGSGIFMRWDGPRAITITNGNAFPTEFESKFFLYQTGTAPQTCAIGGELPNDLIPLKDTLFEMNVAPWAYYPFDLRIRENYQSEKVVEGLFTVVNSEKETLDTLDYRMYVPLFPFSNEGLSIDVDSFFISGGDTKIRFSVLDESNNRPLLRLGSENIVLKENGDLIRNFSFEKDTSGGMSNVDIVFVLDVTGSMSNEIAEVRDNIVQFADNLELKGIDYRLGMVTFLDVVENVYDFTNDVGTFQQTIAAQYAHGGGDGPENSLDALYRASEMQFRADAKVLFIWITDAPYHASDNVTSKTATGVADVLVNYGITVYSIGPVSGQNTSYMPIYSPTGGAFFDIKGNFQDIQLDMAGLEGNKNYMLSYSGDVAGARTIRLEVHKSGKGAVDSIVIGEEGELLNKSLGVEAIQIHLGRSGGRLAIPPDRYTGGEVALFALDGKLLYRQPIATPSANGLIPFANRAVMRTGSYIVRVVMKDKYTGANRRIQKKITVLQ